jgi:predicted transcriptional regulator
VSNKERVIEAVRELPDEATLEEILEHIAIMASIQRGEADADAGRVVTHDEIKKRIASWISK